VITAFVIAACSTPTTPGQSSVATGRAILNTTTVAKLVAAFTNAGLPVSNAHDVTQSRCPQIGCIDAVDSDTVSIIKFGRTGAAERFAGSTSDVFLIEDVVLVFAQSVPPDQRAAYQAVARKAVST
jgi:hypothetical protein